jgi:hypothetical protein
LDKVKWGLRAVTFLCILVPLLYVFVPCMLSGDFLGVFVPPQLRRLASSASSGQAGDLNSTLATLGINLSGFKTPQFEGLTFDNSTGIATLKLRLTNPLTLQRITINQLSFTVKNNTQSFRVHLKERVIVEANQTGILSFQFASTDPSALRSLVNIINGVEPPACAEDLQLIDLYIDVNGIVVQASDLGKLSELFGGESP